MTPVLCLCGEEHPIPDAGRVWFLHPDNHEYAQQLLAGGNPVIPCALVPRSQAFNVDAVKARENIASVTASEIQG